LGEDKMRGDQVNAADVPTLSDTVNLENQGLYLFVGGSGNVKVTTADDSTFTMVGVVAGVWLKIIIKRLWSTGTTATSILVGR
jgi:hypothetical protein